jgi:hypothetical protein
MEWARDKEFGGLRYCLRYGPNFLHLAYPDPSGPQ